MMQSVLGSILVLVVGVTFAQFPSRCMSPQEMQFGMTITDHVKNTITLYTVEYDAPNERVAFMETGVFSTSRQLHTQIYLYRERTMYDINLATKECTKQTLDMPFRPYSIPANATFISDLTVGDPWEEVFAQSWSEIDGALWIGMFSFKKCIPIRQHHFDAGTFIEGSTMDFFDVVTGIYNPGAFTPPAECNK
ncbi:mammalian ependymin-related protein 1-like isoform X2 [Gigantopelta aegis]|uniref:mammalian ependymin-related protein 1-like isoform X1 n=1 Tax=Gigantopelta aegis TaxID=1735272 RepID=UPI001B88E548|nr:mammalian ependymin-related protein 1-like isoform X1 [Gigantopelta aegis]XP_041373972.1 mammalian ependymin-related protein 1-like isoform X2 [Gigantopelta aegis]